MSKNTTDLGKDKISSLLFRLSIPAIVAQIVNVLYNIVDRIYIGRMDSGEIAMAGVGVAFPIIMIVSAFSALMGMGGAPLAAIKMGEGNNDEAEKILSNSFTLLIMTSIVLMLVVLIFQEPILWAFGASEGTIEYALDYLTIYILGTVSVEISLGLNAFINTQGFARVGMMTVVVGAITNIVLDPIFIFTFDMGIKGAALATIISQTVSAIWVLKFLNGEKSKIKIRKKYLIPEWKTSKSIISLGVSPFVMQSTESMVLISLNNQLVRYGGDLAVGAMTIMSSIMQIVVLPMTGLTQGAQPIISYNFGAKQIDRVKDTFKLLFKSSMVFTTLMWSLTILVPQMFVYIFNDDPALVEITVWSMRIYFAGVFACGAQMACQQTFLALGQAKVSLLLALLRKIVLLIPLVFILPNFFDDKLFAVLLAEPVADILAAAATTITFMNFYKRTLSGKENKLNRLDNSVQQY